MSSRNDALQYLPPRQAVKPFPMNSSTPLNRKTSGAAREESVVFGNILGIQKKVCGQAAAPMLGLRK
jgi:hypothetical protein